MFKCKLIQLMATSLHVLETMIFFLELLPQKMITNNITHGITENTVTLLTALNTSFFRLYI